MTNRDIENRIRSAFDNTVPDVLDSVLMQCTDVKGSVKSMTENKKRIPILKIAAVAAAVAVLLATTMVTAAAITFTGLIDKDTAVRAAANYVVQNAETAEEKDILTSYIYAGVAEVEMFEEQQVDLGLKDFRAVYSISLRAGEYLYELGVDAKTGVIISCEREIEEWHRRNYSPEDIENIKKYEDRAADVKKFQGEIDHFDAMLIAEGYAGLYAIPQGINDDYDICKSYDQSGFTEYGFGIEDLPEDCDKYRTWYYEMTHGGYKYCVYIDSVTGEVLNCEITELEEYDGERHLHERNDEYISPYQAEQIFSAATGCDRSNTRDLLCYGVQFAPDGWDVFTEGGIITNNYGRDIYLGNFTMKHVAGGDTVVAAIDAKTGEVLEQYTIYKDPTSENQVPSTEAPDGMISEAVAAAIAFENSDVNEQCIRALKIDLEGGVYHISYRFGYEDFNATTDFGDYRTNTYEIDAVTGKILSFDAFTPDDYIGEEAALSIAYELFNISRENIEKDEVILENNTRGYPQYFVKLYRPNGMDFDLSCELDAINGFDHSSIPNR